VGHHPLTAAVLDAPVRTVDYHTGGEPFRIVPEPPVDIPGASVAERRVFALADPAAGELRRMLCFEPRGHADMYGGFITPADDDGAAFGVLFWHKDGFSTACGHGTIALGTWAVDAGLVPAERTGSTDVTIDVPSGRVTARVHRRHGRVTSVDFVNVPSYVLAREVPVPTSRGEVVVDLAYGGAIYAQLAASSVGLTVEPGRIQNLIAVGREIKQALDGTEHARHPSDDRLSGVYGTIIYDDLGTEAGPDGDARLHQRNVTIFADGEVDRSPCGSGTCARLAVLAATGRLAPGQELLHSSVVGSRFRGRVLEAVTAEGRPAVIPLVTGAAYRTGEHSFVADPADDLFPGFVLR
jgi:proline racemase